MRGWVARVRLFAPSVCDSNRAGFALLPFRIYCSDRVRYRMTLPSVVLRNALEDLLHGSKEAGAGALTTLVGLREVAEHATLGSDRVR